MRGVYEIDDVNGQKTLQNFSQVTAAFVVSDAS